MYILTCVNEWVLKCLCFMHRFAALMNGQLCYCISRFGQEGLSNGCNVPCTNDPSNYCGSYEAMSVYATGQQGMIFKYKSYAL